MAGIEIILPTKRACLTVKEAFLRASHSQSLLLPKLIPLYEMDNLDADLPPKMDRLNRTLLLSRLCMAKPNIGSMDKAVIVAVGLGELLDEFYQYETDISRLPSLVQEKQFADHWNETALFLDIIHTAWPEILSQRGQIDEMDYTIRMIKSYAKKWQDLPPAHPIIMAGFDGAIPAVIELAKTVQDLPQGILFLSGVDTTLSADEFDRLPLTHPQYPLKRLLDALQVKPLQIQTLGTTNQSDLLMHEALKPAEETDSWQNVCTITPEAVTHVKRFECDNTAQEAINIALLLREVLQTPEKTAAFVTTDRALARRVSVEMKRWGIQLDDSAGTPLLQTSVGVYLLLLSAVALNPDSGTHLLALLKHPLSADGQNPTALRFKIKEAEKTARVENKSLSYQTQTDLSDLLNAFSSRSLIEFKTLLDCHIHTAEVLATSADRTGYERLWGTEAGQIAFRFLTQLSEYADLLGEIEPTDYPKILQTLMGTLTVRPKYGMHPRLDILGPIEARFHRRDVMIVGGLNEGTFPQLPDTGPWLNRPMRADLGLPPPENKIAVSAMDFAGCFCGKEVYLTRSLKTDGTPTIISRFLSRLEAVLASAKINWPIYHADLARLLDKPEIRDPIVRPAPKPPVEDRPKKLSVTKIELWMRDPYAVYARYILKLYPLNALESPLKQQLFGNSVHQALEQFVREDAFSTNLEYLNLLGKNTLEKAGFTQADMAFYLPKFQSIASWFIDRQKERFSKIQTSLVEQNGESILTIDGNRHFTLTATADRIDIMKDGNIEIIDYKTGTPPTIKEVNAGFAPQLPLEGYLATQGAFEKTGKRYVSDLMYWRLHAKTKNAKITSVMLGKNADTDSIEHAYNGVKRLITAFYDERVAYESCPAPEKAPRYNDYEHLARAKEWMSGEDEEEEYD